MRTVNSGGSPSQGADMWRQTRKMRIVLALTGLALSAMVLATMTLAQTPGAPGQAGPGGQGGQGRGQGRGGFGGGFGGRMPFASGTITGGDLNAGLITITVPPGNVSQTIRVTQNTQIVSQTAVDVSSLRVGDQVQVQGVPTGIMASSITAGQMPDFLGAGRNRGGAGNAGGQAPGGAPAGQNPGGQPANGPPQPPPASASATGRIVSLNPLTISLSDNVSVVLRLASNAKVTKMTPIRFSDLRAGDRVIASGQTAADGSFDATGIGVNIDTTSMGRGGFGRGGFGPGGFGPGGPGGPGGQGGFGGRGGRRNRGGNTPPAGGTDPGNPAL